MEMSVSAQEDYMTLPVTAVLGKPLGVGTGEITAGKRSLEELGELVEAVKRRVVPVRPDAPCGCIDGRPCVHTLGGEMSDARPKVSGGSITAYVGAELTGWFGSEDGTNQERLEVVDNWLNQAGIPTGGHIDTHAEATQFSGNHTGCGANDRIVENVSNIWGQSEVAGHLTAALQNELFAASVLPFKPLDLSSWDAVAAIKTVSSRDANAVEVLDTGEQQPAHGHAEILVVCNYNEGTTIDRDALVAETGKQVFVIDMWYIDKLAKALARGPEATRQEELLYCAMTAYQVGTYLTLCDGTQRPLFLGKKSDHNLAA